MTADVHAPGFSETIRNFALLSDQQGPARRSYLQAHFTRTPLIVQNILNSFSQADNTKLSVFEMAKAPAGTPAR
jgi:hypothetical protein